ncbi:type II toxin-antitoxin system HicA family toxin [Cellulomonas sp. T2.31MG-18]|uniref:type II toxin-antitoxin system HicA family toxin n=1 Tax=Cellulomonas sp. T2.31MG-18 TaxID=3157619 RepID=UPI00366A8AF0
MKGRDVQRTLEREPLGYRVVRQRGSHRRMEADGRPPLLFSYHDGATVPPSVVRKILISDVGLTEEEAWEVLG